MIDTLLGKNLGHYQLVRLLGAGGMGAVYEGTDTQTDARVAVKVMRGELGENSEALHRFRREAHVAGEIAHPNVARVIDSGSAEEIHYLVMEYIDGRSLRDLIQEKGRIAGTRSLDIIRQTVKGLQAALDHGCIHRDIKPENLMLTNDGLVKIVDFGLARRESSDSFKTATGAVMGTPHYMPPEQASGRNVDHRSDIYSLGATFYHLLTGQTPFKGDSAIAIIQMHMANEPQAITHWNPNVPEAICQVVYRMMRKTPDERFQTYGHLGCVLDDLAEGRTAPSMTMQVVDEGSLQDEAEARKRDKLRLILAGAGLGVFILFAIGVHFYQKTRADEEAAEAKLAEVQKAGNTKANWKTETMPMLIDINKHIREGDDDGEKFESRRNRTK